MSSVNELRTHSTSIEWLPGRRVRIHSESTRRGGDAALVARCLVAAVVAGFAIPAAQLVESSPLPTRTTFLLSASLALFVFFVKFLRAPQSREIVFDWETRRAAVITHMRLGRQIKRFDFDAVREVLLRRSIHRRGDGLTYSCSLKLRLRKGGHEILGTPEYLSLQAAYAALAPAARELSTALLAPLREVTDGDVQLAPVDLPAPPPADVQLAENVISRLNPVPPRAACADGPVRVEVMVAKNGRVTEAKALSGDPSLHDAALSAAREWVFVPTRVSGTPVSVRGTITIEFGLAPSHA
jgi:TonB family protein